MSKIRLESHTKNLARRLNTTARREKRKDNKKIGATHYYVILYDVDDRSNLILKFRKQ